MGYFKPSSYAIESALKEATRYEGGIYLGNNYVTKDHGDYIEVYIEAENAKGHVSFALYFDDNGRLVKWEKHSKAKIFYNNEKLTILCIGDIL